MRRQKTRASLPWAVLTVMLGASPRVLAQTDDAGWADASGSAGAPNEEVPAAPPEVSAPPSEGPSSEPESSEPTHETAPSQVVLVEETPKEKAPPAAVTETEPASEARTVFGSYGRVAVASNLEGGTGRDTDIVRFGTRYDLPNYLELELRREQPAGDAEVRIVSTVAFDAPFFHFDGKFSEAIALRNLYAEAEGALVEGLTLWAGSRMARGDDIYLLNYWPLDNLNLLGGGLRMRSGSLEVAAHGGLYRPDDPFYYQEKQVVPAQGVTPQTVVVLDRPRAVLALRLTANGALEGGGGGKVVGYLERHSISAGQREHENRTTEDLAADDGYVIGAQFGAWLPDKAGFANLFARCSFGLAAYDPFTTPFLVGAPTTTDGARDCLAAVSGNVELSFVGIQLGGYYRHFRDPHEHLFDGGQYAEGVVSLRPYFWIGEHAGIAVDVSHQALERALTDERTGRQVKGSVDKVAVIPFYSPFGRGTFTRPHLSVVYALSRRDDGARAFFPDEDSRSQQNLEQYFSVGAEWWFDSSSY